MFEPKVSIIIPVYNGSNYLRDAIESAIQQTYKNIEIVVVNDGSNDKGETEKIALSYGDKIKYVKKNNGGVATALNVGIKSMTGDYFSWLSHDDLYEPDKIEQQIKILSELDDPTTLINCRYKVVTKDLEYIQENKFGKEKDKLVQPGVKYLLKGYVHGCCLLIHRSHFDRVGFFNEELKTTQDFDLWFRMLRRQPIYFNNNIGVISRAHEQQDSRKLFDYHVKECDELWIKMVNELTQDEKIEIAGSEYNFYKDVYIFLRNSTPYEESKQYLKRMCIEKITEELKDIGIMNELLNETEDYINIKKENRILHKHIDDIYNSKSWKITAPLRKLKKK